MEENGRINRVFLALIDRLGANGDWELSIYFLKVHNIEWYTNGFKARKGTGVAVLGEPNTQSHWQLTSTSSTQRSMLLDDAIN